MWSGRLGTALDQQPGAHHRVARSRALRLCVFICELQATPLIPGRAPLPLPASLYPGVPRDLQSRALGPSRERRRPLTLEPGGPGRSVRSGWKTFFLITSPGQNARIARLTRRVLLPCVEPLVKCLGVHPAPRDWRVGPPRLSEQDTRASARGRGEGRVLESEEVNLTPGA